MTKEKDDLLDATRYAYVMRRYAVPYEADYGYHNDMPDKAIDNTNEAD